MNQMTRGAVDLLAILVVVAYFNYQSGSVLVGLSAGAFVSVYGCLCFWDGLNSGRIK